MATVSHNFKNRQLNIEELSKVLDWATEKFAGDISGTAASSIVTHTSNTATITTDNLLVAGHIVQGISMTSSATSVTVNRALLLKVVEPTSSTIESNTVDCEVGWYVCAADPTVNTVELADGTTVDYVESLDVTIDDTTKSFASGTYIEYSGSYYVLLGYFDKNGTWQLCYVSRSKDDWTSYLSADAYNNLIEILEQYFGDDVEEGTGVLDIANGGTGASNKWTAKSNLGIYYYTEVPGNSITTVYNSDGTTTRNITPVEGDIYFRILV